MSERRNRFLNLESARPLSSPDLKNAQPVAPSEDLQKELHNQRRAQLDSGLALDVHPDDEQPFVRCGQCETDALRDATMCRTCGADLTTPEQRAFNQALWAARRAEQRAEKERDQQAMAEHAQPPQGETTNLEEQQRALGLALAAEVKERESARLAWMSAPRNSLRNSELGDSTGMRLLDRISDPFLRLSCALGCFGLAGACGWELFWRPHQFHPIAWGGLVLLAILFAPRRKPRGLDK